LRSRAAAWSLPLLAALLACAPQHVKEARSALRTNDLATATRLLEQDREAHPDSVEVRLALGEVYYRTARDALDWEGDEGRYLAFLEKSVDEFVIAARLDPKRPEPHFYMAVMDVYRGDLMGALRGLYNSRRLAPGPIADTNIAELYVYRGDLPSASRWNQSGALAGAGEGPVGFNRMLMRWSEGDLEAARSEFRVLHSRHPEMIRTINVAPLPTTPRRFEEFAAYCCASPACGPYLEHACRAQGLEVGRREVSEETLLQELRLEMEKRRRMREIYQQRKELEIEVDEEPVP
jgi:hypothetical protein